MNRDGSLGVHVRWWLCWHLRWAALNHEDVVKVGELGTMPRYMCEFGV